MTKDHQNKVNPLPQGISLSTIYQDFLVYVMKHTRQFFESHVVGGQKIWAEHQENKIIVISHPNGWALQEQAFLRKASIQAGYVPEPNALTHIRFVSEAEASVHFCMYNSNLHDELEPGDEFLVCDAGGSTVDITAYGVKATSPMLELEERKTSACVQAGAVFVDVECRKYIASQLTLLGLTEDELNDYLREATADFESSAKRAFESAFSDYRINTGSRLTRPELQIRRGVMTISGKHIRSFFDEYVEVVVSSIRQQMVELSPKHLLLVGGFGDSPYLRLILSTEFNKSGCAVAIANDAASKAVADGAVIWCAKSSVISRATRMHYGTIVRTNYTPSQPEHEARKYLDSVTGAEQVSGVWSQVVGKGVIIGAQKSIHRDYTISFPEPPSSHIVQTPIIAWTIDNQPPSYWVCNPNGSLNEGFDKICEVEVTLSDELPKMLKKRVGPLGEYYRLNLSVGLKFGGPELLAYLQWKCDGKTHTSPATIVPHALVNV